MQAAGHVGDERADTGRGNQGDRVGGDLAEHQNATIPSHTLPTSSARTTPTATNGGQGNGSSIPNRLYQCWSRGGRMASA